MDERRELAILSPHLDGGRRNRDLEGLREEEADEAGNGTLVGASPDSCDSRPLQDTSHTSLARAEGGNDAL